MFWRQFSKHWVWNDHETHTIHMNQLPENAEEKVVKWRNNNVSLSNIISARKLESPVV